MALFSFDLVRDALSCITMEEIGAICDDLFVVTTRAVLMCGNGGSAATAIHFELELGKEAPPLGARIINLSGNIASLTAIANDLEFEDVFAHHVRRQARSGDVFVAISVSGESPNVLRALRDARALGVRTLALTGESPNTAARIADSAICVRSRHPGVVESCHLSIIHAMSAHLKTRRAA